MVDFTSVEGEYRRVPDILLSAVEGFKDSEEYERLNDTERGLPGVVAASFTRFLVRLQDNEVGDKLVGRNVKTLDAAYRTIEMLATSKDERVRVLLQDEVFDNIQASDATWRKIVARLKPMSKAIFDQWRKENPR